MYDRQPQRYGQDGALKFLIYFAVTTSFLIGALTGSYFTSPLF